ncbi:MAG: lipopolysaccharide heptosyltransferase family protein [Pseudomonadota bacterium]|nr:lipopolysaccharide heptosyltransferase family protein [Pseudomonadota bacterium]
MTNGLLRDDGSDSGAVALPAHGIFRVLVVKVSHTLGNTLLLTPLLQELERRYPGAEVDIVTRNAVAPSLFVGYRNVGQVHRLPAHALRHPLQVRATLRALRGNRYDLAIDADPRSQTGRLLVNFVRARHSTGFVGQGKQGRVGIAVPMPTGLRQSELPVHLLREAAGDTDSVGWPSPSLRLSGAERAIGREQLASVRGLDPQSQAALRPVIGVFANATGAKRLDGEWWSRFLPVLEQAFGGYDFVEIVPMTGHSLLDHRYPAYYTGDIRKLATVLSALSVYISADCGVMHLANASGPRTIGFFPGMELAEWGVSGAGNTNVYLEGRSPERVAAEVVDAIRPDASESAVVGLRGDWIPPGVVEPAGPRVR